MKSKGKWYRNYIAKPLSPKHSPKVAYEDNKGIKLSILTYRFPLASKDQGYFTILTNETKLKLNTLGSQGKLTKGRYS